ncbi:glyceraldehyde-3-phosphate dehydrogenase 3, cytosolic-like isoform X2 [Papaver somniferum]|uniref:glyceraldehyde-3-phosphate dehydrogenase 3, cytosolic-like isoform X2 n=1 Tax=Papaver somniferum TaxID=3469 RepID=UPI000E6FECFD|nr:glyceraldehyde-3-phosphate dehydrogenase 3, cytosolic-like isoform X2 [Papaver somniferum]
MNRKTKTMLIQIILKGIPYRRITMFVVGVNKKEFKSYIETVSNANCTANCLPPFAEVIDGKYKIIEGLRNATHSITATQMAVDGPSSKNYKVEKLLYSSFNIIPNSTKVAKDA